MNKNEVSEIVDIVKNMPEKMVKGWETNNLSSGHTIAGSIEELQRIEKKRAVKLFVIKALRFLFIYCSWAIVFVVNFDKGLLEQLKYIFLFAPTSYLIDRKFLKIQETFNKDVSRVEEILTSFLEDTKLISRFGRFERGDIYRALVDRAIKVLECEKVCRVLSNKMILGDPTRVIECINILVSARGDFQKFFGVYLRFGNPFQFNQAVIYADAERNTL